jgi:hypothetical protein
MLATVITYSGHRVVLICDGKCHKAWGVNHRPKIQLSDNEDDYEWLADGELGDAPINPGTYEGGHAKPRHPDQRHNKWCSRECERSGFAEDGKDFLLTDYSQRGRNIPQNLTCDRCGAVRDNSERDPAWHFPEPRLCLECRNKAKLTTEPSLEPEPSALSALKAVVERCNGLNPEPSPHRVLKVLTEAPTPPAPTPEALDLIKQQADEWHEVWKKQNEAMTREPGKAK